jgi:hypothetical protein
MSSGNAPQEYIINAEEISEEGLVPIEFESNRRGRSVQDGDGASYLEVESAPSDSTTSPQKRASLV